MTNLNQEATLALAGGCCCAFLFVVTLGSLFLFWRIRQQNKSGAPPPEPPVMTRDVHAEPEILLQETEAAQVKPNPVPAPSPTPAPATSEIKESPAPPAKPAKARPPLTPITLPMDGDEDNETVIMDRSNPMGFDDEDQQ
jgi:hypothetical protein